MNESLICCSILRDCLYKNNYNKSKDTAVHTDNIISDNYFNAIVDILEEMIRYKYNT